MLRFCFGPSGAGKSTGLYSEIIEQSLREPETDHLILVPDQYTMQVQRDVVRLHPHHLITNIDVLSFSRLTHRIFDEVGAPDVPILDDLGKTLILRHVAEEISGELPIIGRRLSSPGFIDEMKSILSEFLQYRIRPDDLDILMEACTLQGRLRARLGDLKRVYQAFEETIRNRYVTAEGTMEILSEKIGRSELIRDAVIVFDGFTGFTPIQYQVLSSILQVARSVTISLLMDPAEDPYGWKRGDGSVFALSRKTVADLLALPCSGEPHKISDDIFIKERPVARLRDNPPLAFLEQKIWRDDTAVYPEETGDAIRLFAAEDPVEECRACCREIRRRLRKEEQLRYGDIAILCTDMAHYSDLLAREAERFDIPVYLDETRSVRTDPLIECVESALEVIRTGFSQASVLRFLRSGIPEIDPLIVDRWELYTEALGIRGRKRFEQRFLRTAWRGRPEEEQALLLTEVNTLREQLLSWLGPLGETEGQDVRTVSTALVGLLKTLRAESRMRSLAEACPPEDESHRREYGQIYGKLMGVLDQMVSLLGDQRIPIGEYLALLMTGIDKISIGMIPASVDRVVIGDLERTRMGEKKVIFLMGVNDSLLPKEDPGGGFLSEIEREFLAEAQSQVELAPGPMQRLSDEREYLYMCLTRPTQALCLSWSLLGMDGKSQRPADLIRVIRQLFPAVRVQGAGDSSLADRLETRSNAFDLIASRIREYADGRLNEEEQREFRTVCAALTQSDGPREIRTGFRRLVRSAYYKYQPLSLETETAEQLYGEEAETSVSRLEQYAECPFSHFVSYGLHLREEDRYEVSAMDLGTVYHGVLEQVHRMLTAGEISWRDLTPEQSERFVEEALQEQTAQLHDHLLISNARYRYMLERIRRILLRTVDTVQYQLRKGAFLPAGVEIPFVERESGVILKGRIDRLDICETEDKRYFRIIDYKSGLRAHDPTLLYHGLELQLMMYLRAADRAETAAHPDKIVIPAGVFYYRVNDPVLSAEKDKITGDTLNALRKKLAFSGIANSEEQALLLMDSDLTAGSRSDIMSVTMRSGGGIDSRSHVYSTEDFRTAEAYAGRTIRTFQDKIRAGDIRIAPYYYKKKSACDYCIYRGVCGFDRQIPGFVRRPLFPLTEEEALIKMREETGALAGRTEGDTRE